jgi:hypothetical protein
VNHMISDKKRKQIESQVRKYWRTVGNWWVDDEGLVQVKGMFRSLEKPVPDGELPVQFGEVVGDLNLGNMGLITLKGAPKKVTGWLYVSSNPLTNLQHAPDHVHYLVMFDMKNLQDLTGAPTHINTLSVTHAPKLTSLKGLNETPHSVKKIELFDCDPNLPLLRTLVADSVYIGSPYKPLFQLNHILNDYRWIGKGKSHMLLCSNELKQAGYKENAAW